MEYLTLAVQIIKYLIIAFALMWIIVRMLKVYKENEEKKRNFRNKLKSDKDLFPLKVQAVERLVLFLERVRPDSLVIRNSAIGIKPQQLQLKLLKAIREEFEHNLTQQVYISPMSWSLVKASKEYVTKIINQSADMVTPNTTSEDFSKIVLEKNISSGNNVIDEAIKQLKKEVLN
ncbi:MAG: hypothetical protein ACEPOV_04380 [Hyphomicrobiales bacterium]